MRPIKQSHLRCFVTVAELGSISAAAERLHRTPSAISMTITNLEAQFGRQLFESGSKSRLTPLGRYVLDVASAQLQQFDRGMENIRAYARNDFGRVDIAVVPSFATRYLPDLLESFVSRYPQVVLSIRDASSEQINRLVEQGQIDVGIASPSATITGLNWQPLLSDPLGVVCGRSHPLCQLERALSWQDLAGYRFIANGTCGLIQSKEFETVLATSGMDVQNTTSLLALVATGFGVTTLPRLAVAAEHEEVVFLPTRYDGLQRSIGIITSNERSLAPASASFVSAVKATF
jgi:LysR family transcriptional regulator, carnitine catabolism transcriptional activator